MNCIIDLENKEDTATYVESLIKIYETGKVRLRVVAISASEKKRDGTYTSNFSEFKTRIAAIGLGRAEILKPLAYYGITYYDWCLYDLDQNDPMKNLERKLHETLFPEIEFSYREFCQKKRVRINSTPMDPRWRNSKCDVLTLWSHIYYGSGVFVTKDSNFHKATKKSSLIALGAGEILAPKDAVMQLM